MISTIANVVIEQIACCVPQRQVSVYDYCNGLITEKEAKRLFRVTGFTKLRIADDGVTTSDLCHKAASKCTLRGIDALILVTQTPDYYLPATSHILQDRLGLGHNVLCYDINQGCSGYEYGLYLAALLVSSKQCQKVLLCAGDTISKLTSAADRATRTIFGDAGTATIIAAGSGEMYFNMASFGERAGAIIVPNSRHRKTDNGDEGYLYLDGNGIMNFTLEDVPVNIKELLDYAGIDISKIDLFACHQANKLILTTLAMKLDVSSDVLPFTAAEIGNTSSASIPLVLMNNKDKNLSKVLCCGFGVGLSIGSCIVDLSKTELLGVSKL